MTTSVRYALPILLVLCGCPAKSGSAVDAGSLDPYHSVRPSKVKQDFEKAQQMEYELKDRRIEELK